MLEIIGPTGTYYCHEEADVADDVVIGEGTKVWGGAKLYPGVLIGKNCVIGAGVHVEHDVTLGDSCKVQRGVTLYSGVEAGDYCFFGPNATTTNDRNPRAFGPWRLSRTVFETGSSIGANATIVAGTRVGALALVGAGSVVIRDVLPASVVVGNPATLKGWVGVDGEVVSHDAEMPEEIKALISDPRRAIEAYLKGASGE